MGAALRIVSANPGVRETTNHPPSGLHRRAREPNAILAAHLGLSRSLQELDLAMRAKGADPRCGDVRAYIERFIRSALAIRDTLLVLAIHDDAHDLLRCVYGWLDHLVEDLLQLVDDQVTDPGSWGVNARSMPEFARIYVLGFLEPRLASLSSDAARATAAQDLRGRIHAICDELGRP